MNRIKLFILFWKDIKYFWRVIYSYDVYSNYFVMYVFNNYEFNNFEF